ncbi:hypothetical protein GLYMA_11G158001v4 [Glycine max]|nr:hypothetical protein GLYMA_11G158001v4 [Glycine max]KAH1159643.1 hypothetical protein GYH30_031381 [Glycine max]
MMRMKWHCCCYGFFFFFFFKKIEAGSVQHKVRSKTKRKKNC